MPVDLKKVEARARKINSDEATFSGVSPRYLLEAALRWQVDQVRPRTRFEREDVV